MTEQVPESNTGFGGYRNHKVGSCVRATAQGYKGAPGVEPGTMHGPHPV